MPRRKKKTWLPRLERKKKKEPKITYSDGIGWGRGLGDCYNHKSVSSLNLGTHNWGTARISSCFILTRTYSQTHSDSASTLCPAMHAVCTRTSSLDGFLMAQFAKKKCLFGKKAQRPAWPLTISTQSYFLILPSEPTKNKSLINDSVSEYQKSDLQFFRHVCDTSTNK